MNLSIFNVFRSAKLSTFVALKLTNMTDSKRLISLDVFRGITIAAMILVNFPGSWEITYPQIEHAAWIGLTFADFIFPFFIFIVGISVVLSFSRQFESGKTTHQIAKKSLLRAAKIFAVGFALKFLPSFDFSRIELPGVLQRIALVFLACALLFLFTDWKIQLAIAVGILVVYWLLLTFVPVPEMGVGVLEPGRNLANWLDGVIIPHSLLNKKGYDSEGFLSTFPAIASGIGGLLAGRILKSGKEVHQNVTILTITGILLVLAGTFWGMTFPVIKKIWTSSFALITSGWAFITFAFLIWLIDLKKVTLGTKPWIVFGSNAIAIYVLADVFETIFVKSGIRDGTFTSLVRWGVNASAASLIWAVFSVGVCFITASLLYSKRIFIKL
jgi:predicted acyltransferase